MAENKDRGTSTLDKDRAAGNPLQPAADQHLVPPGGPLPPTSPQSPFAQQPPGVASPRVTQNPSGTLGEVGPRTSEDAEDARAGRPQRSRQKEATAQALEDEANKPNLTQMQLEGQLQSQYQMQGKSPEESRKMARERAREMCQPDDPRGNRIV